MRCRPKRFLRQCSPDYTSGQQHRASVMLIDQRNDQRNIALDQRLQSLAGYISNSGSLASYGTNRPITWDENRPVTCSSSTDLRKS